MLHPMWSASSPFSVTGRKPSDKSGFKRIMSLGSNKPVGLPIKKVTLKSWKEMRSLFAILLALYASLLSLSVYALWSVHGSKLSQQSTWNSQFESLRSLMQVSSLTRRKIKQRGKYHTSKDTSKQSKSYTDYYSFSQSDSNSDSYGPQKMKNRFDLMYTGSLDIGTPKQHFEHMVFDTGSGDLWVMDEEYKGSTVPDKSYLHYYDEDDSSTNKGDLGYWYIAYGSGSCSGKRTMDEVKLDYKASESYELYFANAESVNMNENRKEPVDGILGFAMKTASSMNKKFTNDSQYGPYMTLAEAMNGGIFTFYLSKHESNNFDHHRTHSMVVYKSLLDSSDLRKSYLKSDSISDLLSVQVETKYDYGVSGLWGIKIESISVSGESVISNTDDEEYKDKQYYGILDTGTSYLAMPESIYRLLMDKNFNKRKDCNTDGDGSLGLYTCYDSVYPYSDLGTFNIKFKNKNWDEYESRDYSGFMDQSESEREEDANEEYITLTIEPRFYMSDDSSISIMPINSTIFIFGDTFLRKYMTTFDETNMEVVIGEAQLRDNDYESIVVSFAVFFGVLCFMFLSLLIGQSVYLIQYRN